MAETPPATVTYKYYCLLCGVIHPIASGRVEHTRFRAFPDPGDRDVSETTDWDEMDHRIDRIHAAVDGRGQGPLSHDLAMLIDLHGILFAGLYLFTTPRTSTAR